MAEANEWSVAEPRGRIIGSPSRDGNLLEPAPVEDLPPSPRDLQIERVFDVAKKIVTTNQPERDGRVCIDGDLFELLTRAVYAEPEDE